MIDTAGQIPQCGQKADKTQSLQASLNFGYLFINSLQEQGFSMEIKGKFSKNENFTSEFCSFQKNFSYND